MSAPSFRLYRTAADRGRVTFVSHRDRSIPLVDGVTVLCATREDLAAVLRAASEGGLAAKVTAVRYPGVNHSVAIEDRRAQEAA